MGNGADKILTVLREKQIPVAGVFASDGFVRGHHFHGMRVRSFAEVCAVYPPGACVVLLAFGSARPDVLALFDRVAERYDLYVPDVPVCGNTLFDAAFVLAHRREISTARALFADEESVRIFDLIFSAKLTGSYPFLKQAVSPPGTADLLSLRTVRFAADFGAYNGDSARELLQIAPAAHILCAEPDRRNFRKLSEWAKTLPDGVAECYPVAVLDRTGTALFDASGNRNSGIATGRSTTKVSTVRPDDLIAGRSADYLKFDVEGAEAAALRGSTETIARSSPRLKIACYHRSEDLYALPLLLREIAPRYRLYLRRTAGVPAWDIDLIGIPSPPDSLPDSLPVFP